MMKNVSCNKNKNASVSFFICISSMCVKLFTAFEKAVLNMYLGECPKIKDGHHFHGNEARGKKNVSIFFIMIIMNVQCTMK